MDVTGCDWEYIHQKELISFDFFIDSFIGSFIDSFIDFISFIDSFVDSFVDFDWITEQYLVQLVV